MICSFCGFDQKPGEIFANGMHLVCYQRQRKIDGETQRAKTFFNKILELFDLEEDEAERITKELENAKKVIAEHEKGKEAK